MGQPIPTKKKSRLYALMAFYVMSWTMVGAIAVLGTWKVKAVATEVETKLKERSAQEKLVVLEKVTLQECRTCLLEGILSQDGDAAQLQRLRREFEENSDSFSEYCDVLASGDPTLGIVRPARGGELERRMVRLRESWGGFRALADRVFSAKDAGDETLRRERVSKEQKELQAATAEVDGNIDEVLVTMGDLASGTKAEVATIQRHANLALLASVVLAALLMLLGIWRSIEAQRTREMVARHNAELEQQSAKLGILYDISRAAGQTIDLSELLDRVLGVLTEVGLFRFQLKGAIYLVEGDHLRLASDSGLPGAATGGSAGIGEGQRFAAATEGEVVVLADCQQGSLGCLPESHPHGHVLVPLTSANSTVGLLDLVTPVGVACDGELLQMLSSIGSQLGIAISNARLYEQTKTESLHDALTGLPNRRFMDLQLEKSIALAERYRAPLSLMMIDIDHFKRFNDTRGHSEGDRMLALVARTAARVFRSTDQLFRYGGEEFLAILPETEEATARCAAERARQAVEKECGVTISIGIASHRHSEAPENLVRRADEALYRAKSSGRNRVEVGG